MIKTSEICDALGRTEMRQRLGVTKAAISNASVAGKLPARWYKVVSAMCEAKGIDCPYDLFSFADPKDAAMPEAGECR